MSLSHAIAKAPRPPPNTTPPPPPQLACQNCRKRKVKCGKEKPACGRCRELALPCVYETSAKKSGPKRGHVRMLERIIGMFAFTLVK
ncbi:uncharacterized protein V1518DRAFT_416749 [Limtongia smithiae]|uniref:uncharacterized protein n=1 Tax=Limtongia smithiae TaxID=1125753 RepID=UPI0034CFDFC8